MNTEQERTEFEAWYRLHHGSLDVYGRDASGEYADKQVQGAFNVWQARAALAQQPAATSETFQCDVLELAAQRDELLEALRMVMACAGAISAAPDGLLEMALDDGDEETRIQANAFLVARAAIAKVEGETK